MKAILKNYRQSPRKVRLVTDLIKGKTVEKAMAILTLLPKRASLPIKKLIASGLANAKMNTTLNETNLVIKNILVDKGIVLKRSMPRANGSAFQVLKRTSHVELLLDVLNSNNK